LNRRNFLVRSAFATGAFAAPSSALASLSSMTGAGWQATAGTSARVTIHPERTLATVPPDFIGLGYEISSVTRPGLLTGADSIYVQLVQNLGAGGVIRIGGNTSDYSRYSANAPAASSAYGTVMNDASLRDLGSFLGAVGWKLIWGLNLGGSKLASAGGSPSGGIAQAIAEVKAVLAIAKDHLLAFEIGNEPDLFPNEGHRLPGYTYDMWLAEFRHYKAALRAQLPNLPLAGPDAAGRTDWVTRFAADEGHNAVLLTHHYYRGGQNSGSTIEKLLAPDPKLQPELNKLGAVSRSSGLPFRICEVNSFSGGGRPGVSDTLASALWVLDYMFTLVANGCSGVNMETGINQLDFVSSYSPIADAPHIPPTARPEYYGMLAFSRAAQGRLLASNVEDATGNLKAYVTAPHPGLLTVTLINKGAKDLDVVIDLPPGASSKHASILRLAGRGPASTSGVTLGGAEVKPDGNWSPTSLESAEPHLGALRIPTRAYSAAIVELPNREGQQVSISPLRNTQPE